MKHIPFRQVHLDFHTSGLIKDVGVDFNSKEFAETLQSAHVESVNIFAKCHHGYAYYPSKTVPIHPHLKFDLLGSMMKSLHEAQIRCPLYVSVVWDEYIADAHPEWLQMDSNGCVVGRKPYGTNEENERWLYLCVNSPYLDYVATQVDELIDMYHPLYGIDGFWFDILKYSSDGCSCANCRRGMLKEGLDPSDLESRRDYSQKVLYQAMKVLFERVKTRLPDALVFFNGRQRIDTTPGRGLRKELDVVTHLEIESLASGEWGYNHFPLFIRYNQIFGKEIIGMTGRFHRSWADFGGYKNPAALEYECYNMIANCAKVCVGDQLHPRGRLEKVTYDLIGPVFASIRDKEPWCEGARPVADIGVLAVNDGEYGPALRPRIRTLEAAMQMMLEDHRLFQILDYEEDFTRYKLIICPDILRFNNFLAGKIRDYLEGGGRLILSYQSGLAVDKDSFVIPMRAEVQGLSEFRTSYLRFKPPLAQGLSEADYVVYERAMNVLAKEAEVLAELVHPYFDRNWNHFMSHAQTPPDRPGPYAGSLRYGNVVYFAHPLFRAYKKYGNFCYKKAVSNAIDLLMGPRVVSADIPSTAQLTLTEQPLKNRLILHILHYPRERRAHIDIIEDVIPLYNIPVKMKFCHAPKRVYLAPQLTELPFTYEENTVCFTIPVVRGHAMVVVEAR